MEKKKKHPTTWLGRNRKTILKILSGIGCTGMILLVCFIVSFVYYFTGMDAEFKIIQTRWNLPPDSDFISLETRHGGGGNMAWYEAELIIGSNLSFDAIEEFYKELTCRSIEGERIGSSIAIIGHTSNRARRYRICLRVIYD